MIGLNPWNTTGNWWGGLSQVDVDKQTNFSAAKTAFERT